MLVSLTAAALLANLFVAAAPSTQELDQRDPAIRPVAPAPGEYGELGIGIMAPWMTRQVFLRFPETLQSSVGLHFIDHDRADMPPLSLLPERPLWRRDGATGIWSYQVRTAEGVVFGGKVYPDPCGPWLEFTVRNDGETPMLTTSAQMCLSLADSPEFGDPGTLERYRYRTHEGMASLSDTTPTPADKGRAPWVLMPTRGLRPIYTGPQEIEDAWWVVDQDADAGLLARESSDGARLVAIAWDDSESMLMSNTTIPCMHAGPTTARDLAPGETAVWRGRVYLMHNSPDALLAAYQQDKADGFRPPGRYAQASQTTAASPQTPGRRVRVAAVRVVWEHGAEEPASVVARGFRLAEEAVAQGAKYIVFPECFLHSDREADQVVPGPLTDLAVDFARKQNVYVCAGMIESWKYDWRDVYDTYLTAIVAGPEGLLSKHRKVDINPVAWDRNWRPGQGKTDMGVWPGDDFAMHCAGGIERIGIMICRDTNSSWAWTRVLTQNPQIIFSPNLRDSVTLYGADLPAMARVGTVPVVVAVGHPASESFIVDRDGAIVAYEGSQQRAVVADVTLAEPDPARVTYDVILNRHYPVPQH